MGRSSLLRCTTSLFPKLSLETTLASTSRTSLSKTSREDTWLQTRRTSPPLVLQTSPPRSLSSTTQVRFPTDTAPSSIAALPTLPASSPRSRRRLIVVPESPLKTTPSSSSLAMLPSSSLFHLSLCVSSPSASSLPWVGLLSGTLGRLLLSGSSRPLLLWSSPELPPSLPP